MADKKPIDIKEPDSYRKQQALIDLEVEQGEAQSEQLVVSNWPLSSINMADDKVQLPKFNGDDFPVWKTRLEKIVAARGYERVLKIEEKDLKQGDDRAAYVRANAWVESLILTSLTDTYARAVLRSPSAKQMYEKLGAIHQKKSSASRLLIQQRFHQLQMAANEKVSDYVSRAEYLASQLKDLGVTSVSDEEVANKIVLGLPKRYISFISQYSQWAQKDKSLETLFPRLLAEEELVDRFRNLSTSEQASGSALSTEAKRGRYKDKQKKGQRYNNKDSYKDSNKKRDNDKNKRKTGKNQCFACKEEGHWKKDCPKLTKKAPADANIAASAIVAEIECNIATDVEWLLDSGASHHMTYEKHDFSNYEPLKVPLLVRFGNYQTAKGIAVGDVIVETAIGDKIRSVTLKSVLHVPAMRRKLISLSCISANGKGIFNNREIQISDDSGPLLVAKRQNGLYRVELKTLEANSANVVEPDLVRLWHARLAHVHTAAILKTAQSKAVIGLEGLEKAKLVSKDVHNRIDCLACAQGKQARKHFGHRTTPRATEPGERVHSDLCGPIGTSSLSGKNYFMLFKDEFSNYRHVFFIKTKGEQFDCLRAYVALFTADTKKTVKRLITDRGSEYMSNQIQEYLRDNKIAHEPCAPYTPEQNGFIERENRTVMEAARSMLFHKKLPESFWGEAVNTAVYTLNRVVNSSNAEKTPYELYHNRKPNVSQMRVFGCLAMMKQQEKKRSGYQKKLEARAKPYYFVGYERDFTYRLVDKETGKLSISREVQFDESKTLEHESGTYTQLDKFLEESNVIVSAGESIQELDKEIKESELEEDPGLYELPEPVRAEETETRSRYGLRPRAGDGTVQRQQGEAQSAAVSWALNAYCEDPTTFDEAVSGPDAKLWRKAMSEELDSLHKNSTWDLVRLPEGRKPIKNKWVFKVKRRTDGSVERYKARLVACGYSQKEGIDYKETFSPVVRLESVRILLAIVARDDLELMHFDVKTAFLNGMLEEEIYMDQPRGYPEKSGYVCKLKRSLYGLKQASRAWNTCFVDFLRKFQLTPLMKDECILVRRSTKDSRKLYIAVYVDDGLVCCDDVRLLKEVVDHLKSRFEITVMEPKCFVGLQIERDRSKRKLSISQSYYIGLVAKRFGLENCMSESVPMRTDQKLHAGGIVDGNKHKIVNVPYREAIGSLMYAMLGSRPDISFAVSKLARFCESPCLVHWEAVKRVIRYLYTTRNLGIVFKTNAAQSKSQEGLVCFVDADHAMTIDDRKSTSGCLIKFCDAPIIWKTNKQSVVSQSTTESEFIAASLGIRETLWIRQLLKELLVDEVEKPTSIYIDNQGALKIIRNNQIHSKTKHIDIKFMLARDETDKRHIELKYIESENQQADILTKALEPGKFGKMRAMLGLGVLLVSILAVTVHAAPTRWVKQPHTITFHYRYPCDNILNDNYDKLTEESWEVYKCKEYFAKWKRMTKEVAMCRAASRYARSPLALIAGTAGRTVAKELATIAWTAGSNFIRSKIEPHPVDRHSILTELDKQSDITYFRNKGQDYLNMYSNIGQTNPAVAQRYAAELPATAISSSEIDGNLVADIANLEVIAQKCRAGKMAVRELNDMLNTNSFEKYSDDDTEIVKFDADHQSITFMFNTYQKDEHIDNSSPNTKGEKAPYAVVIVGIGLVTLLCLLIACLLHNTLRKAPDTSEQIVMGAPEVGNSDYMFIRRS